MSSIAGDVKKKNASPGCPETPDMTGIERCLRVMFSVKEPMQISQKQQTVFYAEKPLENQAFSRFIVKYFTIKHLNAYNDIFLATLAPPLTVGYNAPVVTPEQRPNRR